MSIKAIFYDFDGVIKESTQIKTVAFYKLYIEYSEEVAQKVMQHHIENGGVSRFEKFKIYHKEFLGIDLKEDQINELANRFSKIVLQEVIQCDYVVGALECIENLSLEYLQFIVTGTPQNEIEYILEELDIAYYFKGVFGSPKDKIEISKHILKKYCLQSNEVVFVGDALTDYKTAVHHHFKFILREHSENELLFKSENVTKIKNLITLEQLIKQ